MLRKIPLVNNEIYHIVSRSIAGYKIFNYQNDYNRFIDIVDFYQKSLPYKYSIFIQLSSEAQEDALTVASTSPTNKCPVAIIAYCIMPTHIHLVLKQTDEGGITKYIGNILNSYSKYFNIKYQRKGPLWESRFKSIRIDNDAQLLHLTRYIHLNPTSAGLVEKPKDWKYSSIREYTSQNTRKICAVREIPEIPPKQYMQFVDDRIAYQRDLSFIKSQLLENYTG